MIQYTFMLNDNISLKLQSSPTFLCKVKRGVGVQRYKASTAAAGREDAAPKKIM